MKAQDVLEGSNGGIVGLDDELSVFGGYDERFAQAGAQAECPEWIEPDHWDAMPKSEKLVLADLMISRWQRYRAMASEGKPERIEPPKE